WDLRRFLHERGNVDFGIRFRARRRSLATVFWSGGRGPRSFRLPRARLLSPSEFGGVLLSEAEDTRGKQPNPFHRAAPAIGANEVLVFQTLHQLNHPAFRITSQLGEKRHFYLASARLGASGLGAGINWINTRYRAASAAGMAPKRNSRLISDMRSPPSRILTDLDHRICWGLAWFVGVDQETFKEICSFHMQQWRRIFPPPPGCALLRRRLPLRHLDLDRICFGLVRLVGVHDESFKKNCS